MNQKTKFILLVLFLVLLLGGAYFLYAQLGANFAPDQLAVEVTAAPTEASTEPPVEDPAETTPAPMLAPDFTVYDMDGNPVNLYDYVGKPLIVNFWASWCGPCKMEMPDFHEKYLALGENVQFLMINMTDGSRETVTTASEFIAEHEYTFPVFYDTANDAGLTYNVYSLPTTFFINAEGHAIAKASGAIDAETLQKGIDMIYMPVS